MILNLTTKMNMELEKLASSEAAQLRMKLEILKELVIKDAISPDAAQRELDTILVAILKECGFLNLGTVTASGLTHPRLTSPRREMNLCCPNCEEAINADNDLAECEACGLEGCENCLKYAEHGLCEACYERKQEKP